LISTSIYTSEEYSGSLRDAKGLGDANAELRVADEGAGSVERLLEDSGAKPGGIAGDGVGVAEEGPKVTLGLCSFPISLGPGCDEVFARDSVDET
jgi:hypothetical protein